MLRLLWPVLQHPPPMRPRKTCSQHLTPSVCASWHQMEPVQCLPENQHNTAVGTSTCRHPLITYNETRRRSGGRLSMSRMRVPSHERPTWARGRGGGGGEMPS